MTALLEARNVTKVFGGGVFDRSSTAALESFSLAIDRDRPSIIAVVGESGSGKTTLARLLLGLTAPTDGQVFYEGQDLQQISRAGRRKFRRDVQVIFQDPYGVYNPFYRIDHVLTTPIAKFGLAKSRAEARTLIDDVLRAVGLRPEETLGRFPHQLSGGQQQRVGLARALAADPPILLMDEPFGALDPITRASLQMDFKELDELKSKTIILVTHDLREAVFLADRVFVMSARPGRILVERPIDLPRPRDLDITFTAGFQDIVHELRGHIVKARQ